MFESESDMGATVIDLSINTESAEEDQAATELLEKLDLEQLVSYTLQTVHVEQAVILTLVISGDSDIQELNRRYRGQDKPTDVLSFPLLDQPLVDAPADLLWQAPEETEEDTTTETEQKETARAGVPTFVTPAELNTNLGDIMISWPTTRRQAEQAGHTMAAELLFLLCHGVLHLVGYDDQTEAGYAEMVRLQTAILAGIGQEG